MTPRRGANTVLWASMICIVWGIVQFVIEIASGQPVGRGPNGETLILIGVLSGLNGQALFRLALKVEALEARLAKRPEGERNQAES